MGNSNSDQIGGRAIAWIFVRRDLEAHGLVLGPPDGGDERHLVWTGYSARCRNGVTMPTSGLFEISAASKRPYHRAGRTAPNFMLLIVDPIADSVSVRLIDLAEAIDGFPSRARFGFEEDELAA